MAAIVGFGGVLVARDTDDACWLFFSVDMLVIRGGLVRGDRLAARRGGDGARRGGANGGAASPEKSRSEWRCSIKCKRDR